MVGQLQWYGIVTSKLLLPVLPKVTTAIVFEIEHPAYYVSKV